MRPLAQAAGGLLAGTVFGVGLSWSQMTDPHKVLAFLDIAGRWDASLLFVIGGAVAVAFAGYRLVLRRKGPLFDDAFHLNFETAIDTPLLAGAALFGIGWGLAGYCPGPAIASLGFGNTEMLWFLPALVAGIALRQWSRRLDNAAYLTE
ncbi:MAG TPA: DUF6691 family protein [Rhizobacter sp.]|nr:DUF6691 family protein [Rhizobacter sp.]